MFERQLSKEELLSLLGNCILALTLSNDERILVLARAGADKHLETLNKRFPEWKDELHSVSQRVKDLGIRETT